MAQLELVRIDDAIAPISAPSRADHLVIAHMVAPSASVLDIGCGDGALLALLTRERGARARGFEMDPAKAQSCVQRGLAVVQGDAERDLDAFPSASFDYVVMSRSLQRLRRPHAALTQAARIGERVIVSVVNAGHWRNRLRLLGGRFAGADWGGEVMHPCTLRDLADAARAARLSIERAVPIARGQPGAPFANSLWRANLLGEEAVFLLAS